VVAARVTLREITNEEGNRLLRIVRRTSGSVVTWRRAQIVLLSAQAMTPTRISEVVFTDPDTVREVIHNFNRDGFDALYPRYGGGRPQTFTLPKRQEIKRIALTDPQDLDQPFATWSLSKLADYVVAEGVVTDISHEGLRRLLREEGVRFQAVRTWKRSNDPNFEAKRDRIVELYDLAEQGEAVVICLDEFGPLNLQPQPGGRSWAPRAKPRRIRATYTRPHGIRHLISLRRWRRPALRAHQETQGPRRVRRVLPLHPLALPARDPTALRAGQLQRASRRTGPRLGHGQQRRAGLHAVLRVLAESHRSPVPGAALLHARWHRPPRPRHPGPADPPLHRLAQPQHRQPATPHAHQHGKRCLTPH
jgi:transposase